MLPSNTKEKKRPHPYLSGNFAPVHRVQPLISCEYSGTIPAELAGGEYVRNGGNPVMNEMPGRDAHWFDGDGMLSGVAFQRTDSAGKIQPEFVNQYILTDLFLSSITSPYLQKPILPSIATHVNPLCALITVTLPILRTLVLVALSHLPGSQQVIKKISVANTAVIFHDGRALATCESGVPMRISLPGLETVGWFDGGKSEGEIEAGTGTRFGNDGVFGWMKEWTTAHPRVDPRSSELILYHNTFIPPYVHYSIIPPTLSRGKRGSAMQQHRSVLNIPVPGIQSAKMMHDFGVSNAHTIIMDLPLSLDPLNLLKRRPVVSYDSNGKSRFGVFPRYRPEDIKWFETNPCCIFHTANTWDSCVSTPRPGGRETPVVNMLVCRLTSAALVFSAGDLAAPIPIGDVPVDQQEEEQCRLYFYQFCLSSPLLLEENRGNKILHQWALSKIPFEFPSLRDSVSMSAAKYIYGCSVGGTTFGAALGRAVKINSLVKIDVERLIQEGIRNPPTPIRGYVDGRNIAEIAASNDSQDPIKVFMMPEGWFAQECRFVPRNNGSSEDDGWILSYVFDESSQLNSYGECTANAKSELWIIDAMNMKDVVARIYLPQRVPYGLHGNWFSEKQVKGQRPVNSIRSLPFVTAHDGLETRRRSSKSFAWKWWMEARGWLERRLA